MTVIKHTALPIQHCTFLIQPLDPILETHRAKACNEAAQPTWASRYGQVLRTRALHCKLFRKIWVPSCKTFEIPSQWKLSDQKNPKITQSKKTAHSILLVFAPLHHGTNKDSPSKTLITSLTSCCSSRFSFDSCCCRQSSTESETAVQTQLWFKGKQNKAMLFQWAFSSLDIQLFRKDRVCFSSTRVVVQRLAGSWGWASALFS